MYCANLQTYARCFSPSTKMELYKTGCLENDILEGAEGGERDEK